MKNKCEKYEKFLLELKNLLQQRLDWHNVETNAEELNQLLQEINQVLEVK